MLQNLYKTMIGPMLSKPKPRELENFFAAYRDANGNEVKEDLFPLDIPQQIDPKIIVPSIGKDTLSAPLVDDGSRTGAKGGIEASESVLKEDDTSHDEDTWSDSADWIASKPLESNQTLFTSQSSFMDKHMEKIAIAQNRQRSVGLIGGVCMLAAIGIGIMTGGAGFIIGSAIAAVILGGGLKMNSILGK